MGSQENSYPDEEYQEEYYDSVGVFNVWLSSNDKRIDEVVEKIYEDNRFKGQKSRVLKQLKILLLNFVRLKKHKPKGVIRYSRRNRYWSDFNKDWPNPYKVSSIMDNIVDALESSKLLNVTLGSTKTIKVKGKLKNIRKQTRIQPSTKFTREYITPYNLLDAPIEYLKEFPLVRIHIKIKSKYSDDTRHIIKEAKGKTAISGFLKTTKEKLRSYNTYLKCIDIKLDDVHKTKDIIEEVDTILSRRVYRVFNDNEVTQGGRVYGGFWTQIRSVHRPYILIKGNKTVECDFSSQHANMLYGYCLKKSIDEALGEGIDPYMIEGYPRPLGKLVFTMALNVRRANLKKALENKFKEALKGNNEKDKEEAKLLMPYIGSNFNTFMESFEELHKPVLQYLYPHTEKVKWWHEFQFYDSQIAMYVLEQTRLLDIPCLSIHDSFIVEEKHEETLKRIMKESYLKAEHIPNLSKCIPSIRTEKRKD